MPSTPAARPPDEAERLETLRRLEILDTLPEQAYDDLTTLAAEICGTPVSIIALVDEDRQWYKSAYGSSLKQTDRNVAFCAHAILQPDEIFTVTDALSDPRFADNPFVTGELKLRFYAGAPIVTASGHAVGAMCVVDTEPRVLTERQRECLRALARQASQLLDLRAKATAFERDARAHEKQSVEAKLKQKRGLELLELVLRGDQMGLWDLQVQSGAWTVNAREHLMLGYGSAEAAADHLNWRGLVHPDDWPMLEEAMEPHLNGRTTFYECTHRMRHADGHYLWVLHRGVIVERNVRGEALRIVGTHVDVTEARQREEQRRIGVERLEFAFTGGDHGLWDWRVATGHVIHNDRWGLSLGYTTAESEALSHGDGFWEKLLHPDDREATRAAMRRHLGGLTPMFEAEFRLLHKDGHYRWVLDRAKVIERDALGHAVRVVGTTTLIHQRKTDELAMKQMSTLLAQTGAMARVGGWSIDIQKRVVVWSEEVYRIHDLNPKEAPTLEQALSFFTPESRPVVEAAVADAERDGTPWDLELEIVTARGRRVWIHTIGQAETTDGRVQRFFGVVQDVTDRKHAEERQKESERQLRLVMDSVPAVIARVDAQQRYTFVNSAVERVFGAQPGALLGKTMREVRDTHDQKSYDAIAPHVAMALAGKRVSFEDQANIRGRHYFYQTHYAPEIDAGGKVLGFFTMTFDITERRRAELRRSESEERLRGMTDNVPAMIAELDTKGRFRFANETFRTWLGVAPSSIIGQHVADAIGSDYYAGSREPLARALKGEKVSFEQTVELASGARCLQTDYLPHFDVSGAVTGVYALTSDITELKDTHRRLDTLARFDQLTGLANRRQLEEKLIEAMARTRRTGVSMAVLYLDIDRFKTINDRYGHAAGDEVLVEFGRRLEKSVRETDLVARQAGDEFVVLFEGIADETEAHAVATKMVAAMHRPFVVDGITVDVTTSVGVATFDGRPGEMATLLSRADRALYEAKAEGRDRVSVAET